MMMRFKGLMANTRVSLLCYLTCLTITIIFCIHLLWDHGNTIEFNQKKKEGERCDIFSGQWIRDPRGPLYTNESCTTIPFLRNCFLLGRKDTEFLHWRWKPDKCELPRFDPQALLTALRGKTMAFIGDSLARNQMESLLCLLSTIDSPKETDKHAAAEEALHTGVVRERLKSTTWEFPKYEFKLIVLWSPFFISATERVLINGTATGRFEVHLDQVDTTWSEKLPEIDYAVFSGVQWFFRPNYMYEGGNFIGCVNCNEPNVTDVGPGLAIRRAFRAAVKAINDCKNCKQIFTLLRTYSPRHFENGDWNTGGVCNRTRPVGREEVDRARPYWDIWKIQMEELEMARVSAAGNGNRFEVVDVSEMMWMRPDAHPGLFSGDQWIKNYSDCVHWCMPGPIDTWNELLFEVIKTRITLSSKI